ncbi:unnamed protein product [Peniophora sp. CBMAI 1063]|nr:unnamed protein product [Peniophora sp. CBMAI 1063]
MDTGAGQSELCFSAMMNEVKWFFRNRKRNKAQKEAAKDGTTTAPAEQRVKAGRPNKARGMERKAQNMQDQTAALVFT